MQTVHPVSFESACSLLDQVGLDSSDLSVDKLAHFHGVSTGEKLVGMIGMECYPPVALLRSLAVVPDLQGAGLGSQLVSQLEARAVERGIGELYLLTTSASHFFTRLGYEVIDRSSAPFSIQATSQFNDLCPASAVWMKKSLR